MVMEKLYGVSEAARFAECGEDRVRRAERAGLIQAQRVAGRRVFNQQQVDKLREHIQQRRAA
jgi:DNA-binding transcriptional MerR regulator